MLVKNAVAAPSLGMVLALGYTQALGVRSDQGLAVGGRSRIALTIAGRWDASLCHRVVFGFGVACECVATLPIGYWD